MKKRYLCIVLALILCGSCWLGQTRMPDGKAATLMSGKKSLEDFSAYPGDGEDDTEGIRQALASGCAVQLAGGVYEISDTIELTDQILIGASTGNTFFRATFKDKSKPILRLNGRCTVSDINIEFADGILDYSEREGERVAIWLGNKKPADGSQLRNLRFVNVGTAIYSPNKTNMGVNRLLADTMFIVNYSYRGVDFRKTGQYGNTFSNLYMGGTMEAGRVRDAGFAVEGEEYNLVVEQLNLEHLYYNKALLLKNCYGARFGSIHMEANGLSGPNTGCIWIENSDVHLDGVTQYYNPIDYKGCGLIQLADAGSKTGNRVSVGTIHLKGLNNVASHNHQGGDWNGLKSQNAKDFKVFIREAGAKGTFTVDVEAYVWGTWYGESDLYKVFPCDTTGINYVSKGVH